MCGRNESTHQTRSPISSVFCIQLSPSLFFPEAYLSGVREGGGADNVVVHRWDGFSIKMGERGMHAHVPRRRRRAATMKGRRRILLGSTLMKFFPLSLLSLPSSHPRCSFLRGAAAEEQKRIIQESVGDKKRHFGVRLSVARPIHRQRQPQSECDVCEQIAPLFLKKPGNKGRRNAAKPRWWPHLIVSIPAAQWSNKAALNRYWSLDMASLSSPDC